jgi:hypothetical protein
MSKRFTIKIGRFGAYFYDTINKEDVDLKTALNYMNEYDNLRTINTPPKLDIPKKGGPE